MLGIVTGLRTEARIARPLGLAVAGGGTLSGVRRAAERLADRGATSLISFGIAGGLDPALATGTIVVPARVVRGDAIWRTHSGLTAALGGPTATTLACADAPVASTAAKRALHVATGGVAVDMESAAVAEVAESHGLPFAVLRAVCDPAGEGLPPGALAAFGTDGGIAFAALLRELARSPRQIGALLRLAVQMRAATAALAKRVADVAALASDPRF